LLQNLKRRSRPIQGCRADDDDDDDDDDVLTLIRASGFQASFYEMEYRVFFTTISTTKKQYKSHINFLPVLNK